MKTRFVRSTALAALILGTYGGARVAPAATLEVGPGQTYATIHEAVAAAGAYDTILVHDGTYVENVIVDNWTVPGDPDSDPHYRTGLTVQSVNGAALTTVQAADTEQHAVYVEAGQVTWSGFALTGATGLGKAGIYVHAASHCAVTDNVITGNYIALALWQVDASTVSGNQCTANAGSGLVLSESSGNTVTDNVVSLNDWMGITLSGNADHNVVANNTVADNYANGVYVHYSSEYNEIRGNAISNNNAGIALNDSDFNVISRNTITGNNIGIDLSYCNDCVIFLNDIVDNSPYQAATHTEADCTWNSAAAMDYEFGGGPFNGFLGNYWNDFTDVDANGDGVWDNPYDIYTLTGSVQDLYPLVAPVADYAVATPTGVQNLQTGETFTTLQAAIDDADTLAGHTLQVGPGQYNENVNVSKAVLLVATDGPSETLVTAVDPADHVFEVTAATVTISGLTLTGATDAGAAGVYVTAGAQGCTIANCVVSGNYDGINVAGASNGSVTGTTVTGHTHYDFVSTGGSDNTVSDLLLGSYVTTVSFTYTGDIGVREVTAPPAAPGARALIGKYVQIDDLAGGALVDLEVRYDEAALGVIGETSLTLWRWDGSQWLEVAGSAAHPAEDYVSGSLDTFSIFAPGGYQQHDIVWTSAVSGFWNCGTCWSLPYWPANTGDDRYSVIVDDNTGADVVVTLDGGLAVAIDNLAVSPGDTVNLVNASLTLSDYLGAGHILNDGTVALSSPHFGNYLRLAGDVSIGGSGELVLSPAGPNYVWGYSGAERLTNEAGHTIRGGRRLGNNLMTLTNEGLIQADEPSWALEVDPTDSETVYNTGVMQSANGGTLWLTGGTFDNTGGVVQALASSTTQISGATLSFGTLTTQDDGVVEVRDWGLVADATNTGLLRVPNGGGNGYLQGTLINDGTLEVASVHFSTTLWMNGDVTLAGSGELVMLAAGPNMVRGATATDRLTNAATHTIRGARELGYNGMALTNEGLISADSAGATLVVNPEDTVINYNTGTMQSAAGGILQLTGGTFDNDGGVIQALAGSTTQISGATVSHGTLTTADDGVIELRGGGLVADATNTGLLRVPNTGGNGYLQGTVTNEATLELASAGNSTTLWMNGDVTLTGNGELVLLPTGPNIVRGATATDRLTNAATHTIRGARELGYNGMALTNEGLISADSAGATLVVNPEDTVINYNTGTMQSAAGGILQLTGGTFDNDGGVIQALAGSTTQISGATVSHGTLTTADDGVIELRGGGLVADATNTGLLRVPNTGGNGYLQGTVTNEATLELASAGNSTTLWMNGDVTLTGNGELVLLPTGPNIVRGATATDRLTNAATHTIRGARELGYNGMALTNEGLIEADVSGAQLTINPEDSVTNYNTGTLQATGGGTLALSSGLLDNSGGIIQARDASTTQIADWARVEHGELRTEGTGVVELRTNGTLADVTNAGYLLIPNCYGPGRLEGTLTNNGTFEVQGTHCGVALQLAGDAWLDGVGELLLGGHNDITPAGAYTLTNGPSHTIRTQGTNDVQPTLVNEGTVDVPAGTTLNLVDVYSPLAGSQTVVDGALNRSGTTSLEGTLRGSGTWTGSVVATGGGTVEPGAAVGTLTIAGHYTQDLDGQLRVELGGTTPGTEHDVLHVTGSATLDGELAIELVGGFTPQPGQQFVILTAGAVAGQGFATVASPVASRVVYNSNNVTLVLAGLGDFDADGDVDLDDYLVFEDCLAGPATAPAPVQPGVTADDCLAVFDFDTDDDVDLADFRELQAAWEG